MRTKAVILAPDDNVGIALADLGAGSELDLNCGAQLFQVKLAEPIPYQHKFSVTAIGIGEENIKDGVFIGVAIDEIQAGRHVHVHNMTGTRSKPLH
jgi:altronate dehydratase small subunit